MPNTYTQLYIQIIFSTYKREPTILGHFEAELYKYIAGIIKNKDQKLLNINGTNNHLHILVGIKPNKSVSELVKEIKSNSSKFINQKQFIRGKFNWQEGFGAFSYSHSQIDKVINYINNQKVHHKRKTFEDEYIDFMNKFGVEFDKKYIL